MINYNYILDFWFKEIDNKQWFIKSSSFDSLVKTKFSLIHRKASFRQLYLWRKSIRGRLAEIIVLDQFSRNIFRNNPQSFETDSIALYLSKLVIKNNLHANLNAQEKLFIFMPFMHSETLKNQQISLSLFKNLGLIKNCH